MKAKIISTRFNPGHASHIEAMILLLNELNFSVKMSVNKELKKFIKIKNSVKNLNENELKLSILMFPSINGFFELFVDRFFNKYKTVYIYHEPFTSFKSYYNSGFSVFKVFKVFLISLISKATCVISNKVILPSENAFNILNKNKFLEEKIVKLNLIFHDESDEILGKSSRKYISYIGTIAEDHAFEEFVNLIYSYTKTNKRNIDYKFLIASKNYINSKFLEQINYCLSKNSLILKVGKPMSNLEINDCFKKSLVVWNAYRRSMQSGVLPKAYMFGTPVIISKNNKSEFFSNTKNGILLKKYELNEFISALNQIDKNFQIMSEYSRNFYKNNFDYKSLITNFKENIIEK